MSEVIGSWKIMPIRSPRMRRICVSVLLSSSSPSNMMLDSGWIRAFLGSSCIKALVETDLPLPDSPTIARVSPGRISKLTFFTASTTPSLVVKLTLKLRTCKSGLGDIVFPYSIHHGRCGG
ncbi:Uncharacterised protein [Vibrio cholerae]|nr:Uncharacterised protein [Vibrio cholerae]